MPPAPHMVVPALGHRLRRGHPEASRLGGDAPSPLGGRGSPSPGDATASSLSHGGEKQGDVESRGPVCAFVSCTHTPWLTNRRKLFS